MLELETYLRFGMQRKKGLLGDIKQAYHGIVLPANILLYQYKSTPTLIHRTQKPYFTDPMSYLLGRPYDEFKHRTKPGPGYKPSFEKLMIGHGLDPSDYYRYDHRRLIEELADDDRLCEFVESVFAFQRDAVWDVISASKDLIDAELSREDYLPEFLVPPYFMLADRADSEVARLNHRIWEVSRAAAGGMSVRPIVFVSQAVVASGEAEKFAAAAAAADVDGYVLWVDSFDERRVEPADVKCACMIVKALAGESGRPVGILYGGYLALTMAHFGVTGVSHGMAYSESRSVGAASATSSGPAPIRYYVPQLHQFLALDAASTVLKARDDLMCPCPICSRVLRGDPDRVVLFQDLEDYAEMHFLWNRNRERRFVQSASLDEVIDALDLAYDLNDDLGEFKKTGRDGRTKLEPILSPAYLKRWADGLRASTA